jgi:hypothetical protein
LNVRALISAFKSVLRRRPAKHAVGLSVVIIAAFAASLGEDSLKTTMRSVSMPLAASSGRSA